MSPETFHPQLINNEVREKLPPIKSQRKKGLEAIAYVKFFVSGRKWAWYATEGSTMDANGNHDTDNPEFVFDFFGLIIGPSTDPIKKGIKVEINEFSSFELESIQRAGLPIQRDLNFESKTLKEIIESLKSK